MERTLEDLRERLSRAVKDPMKVVEIAVASLGSPTRAYDLVLGSTMDKQLAQDWRGVLLLYRDQEKYGTSLREALGSLFLQEEYGNPVENQGESVKMSEAMYVFTLHENEEDFRIKGAVLARSILEAASILGGEFVKVEELPMGSSTNRDEFSIVGKIRFARELFHGYSHSDRNEIQLYHNYVPSYYQGLIYRKGPGLYLCEPGESGKEFFLRRNPATLPGYVDFS
jgi:hypothetical protein